MSARVRGMGVALMTRTWALSPLSASAPRCATPKRCCSSVTTRPSLANSTPSLMSAWVPTASCASPEARAASVSRFAFAPMEPVSFTVRIPKGSRKPESVAKCCSHRSSVGAMKALWQPFFAAYQMSAAAQRVLPEPTSPWMSRFIARPEAMSAAHSSTARSCAAVGAKGRLRINSPKSAGAKRSPGLSPRSPRSRPMAQTSVKSSANTSRPRARARARASAGKCMFS